MQIGQKTFYKRGKNGAKIGQKHAVFATKLREKN
jgi:hypothetical protein